MLKPWIRIRMNWMRIQNPACGPRHKASGSDAKRPPFLASWPLQSRSYCKLPRGVCWGLRNQGN